MPRVYAPRFRACEVIGLTRSYGPCVMQTPVSRATSASRGVSRRAKGLQKGMVPASSRDAAVESRSKEMDCLETRLATDPV
jgi:hypothetical protein